MTIIRFTAPQPTNTEEHKERATDVFVSVSQITSEAQQEQAAVGIHVGTNLISEPLITTKRLELRGALGGHLGVQKGENKSDGQKIYFNDENYVTLPSTSPSSYRLVSQGITSKLSPTVILSHSRFRAQFGAYLQATKHIKSTTMTDDLFGPQKLLRGRSAGFLVGGQVRLSERVGINLGGFWGIGRLTVGKNPSQKNHVGFIEKGLTFGVQIDLSQRPAKIDLNQQNDAIGPVLTPPAPSSTSPTSSPKPQPPKPEEKPIATPKSLVFSPEEQPTALSQQLSELYDEMSNTGSLTPQQIQQLDSGYMKSTSYWHSQPTGQNDGHIAEAELLNFVLTTPEFHESFRQKTSLVVPWSFTPEELAHPIIQQKIALIDKHIALINQTIQSRFQHLTPDSADYQRKLAIAIAAFCTAPQGGNHRYWLRALRSEGLNAYGRLLENEGLNLIYKIEKSEGTIFDLLTKNEGSCTEFSYLYAFIGLRAGLKVGFEAAAVEWLYIDHLFNTVFLPGNHPIKIDLSGFGINSSGYKKLKSEDFYATLANFYTQLLVDPTIDLYQTSKIAYQLNQHDPRIASQYFASLYLQESNTLFANTTAQQQDLKNLEKMEETVTQFKPIFEKLIKENPNNLVIMQGCFGFFLDFGSKSEIYPLFQAYYQELKKHNLALISEDNIPFILQNFTMAMFAAAYLADYPKVFEMYDQLLIYATQHGFASVDALFDEFSDQADKDFYREAYDSALNQYDISFTNDRTYFITAAIDEKIANTYNTDPTQNSELIQLIRKYAEDLKEDPQLNLLIGLATTLEQQTTPETMRDTLSSMNKIMASYYGNQ